MAQAKKWLSYKKTSISKLNKKSNETNSEKELSLYINIDSKSMIIGIGI